MTIFQPGELPDVENRALTQINAAMKAWHEDRLKWVDNALRSLGLVNAGGAVAVAAFLGASRSSLNDPSDLILSFKAFSIGLIAITAYPVYLFYAAEIRVWLYRIMRPIVVERLRSSRTAWVWTAHPPTRIQLAFTYFLCTAALAAFVFGVYTAMMVLPAAASYRPPPPTIIFEDREDSPSSFPLI